MISLPKKKKVGFRQVRVTIPTDDPIAIEWINNQRRDASLAIRLLIHRQVRRNGIGNIFATDDNINDSTETVAEQTSAKPVQDNKSEQTAEPQIHETVPKPEPAPRPRMDKDDLQDLKDMMG